MGFNIYKKPRTQEEAVRLMKALASRNRNQADKDIKNALKEMCKQKENEDSYPSCNKLELGENDNDC